MTVRNYKPQDYEAVKDLYLQGDLYGGQFDEARDSSERLQTVTQNDPNAILVYEGTRGIVGTVSLIENGRVAWLFRFAVAHTDDEQEVTQALYKHAISILKTRGHTQILVYSPDNNSGLAKRYLDLGMQEGGAYRCFWVET
jgi:predicted N-acetyltransferase YhbS